MKIIRRELLYLFGIAAALIPFFFGRRQNRPALDIRYLVGAPGIYAFARSVQKRAGNRLVTHQSLAPWIALDVAASSTVDRRASFL